MLTWVLWDWKMVNIHSLTVDNSNKCRGLSLIFIANFMGCLLLICYICERRLQSLFAFGSQNSNLQSTIKLQSLQPQFQSKHHTPHPPNTQTVSSRISSKCFGPGGSRQGGVLPSSLLLCTLLGGKAAGG